MKTLAFLILSYRPKLNNYVSIEKRNVTTTSGTATFFVLRLQITRFEEHYSHEEKLVISLSPQS